MTYFPFLSNSHSPRRGDRSSVLLSRSSEEIKRGERCRRFKCKELMNPINVNYQNAGLEGRGTIKHGPDLFKYLHILILGCLR